MSENEVGSSTLQWLLSFFGVAAGGGAMAKTVLNASAVESRLAALEKTQDEHNHSIQEGAVVVARIDGKLEAMNGTLEAIRTHLMESGRN